MLIEKKLNHTEKTFGYLFWGSEYDEELKQILKTEIEVKIGNLPPSSKSIDFKRRRIYIGSEIKQIKCDAVRIKITPKLIHIECA